MTDALDLFLESAAAWPGGAAVSEQGEIASYEALEDRARRIAARVAALKGAKVLIALPQGASAYAAMLGVGLGGGFYAPLNTSAPPDKLQYISRRFDPDLIISEPSAAVLLRESAPRAELLTMESLQAAAPLRGHGKRHELAYVIFTSGSTGQPKGVAIPRAALDHYVGWVGSEFVITPKDRVSQHPNIAFDLSVMDIYGALCHGATLCPLTGQGDRLMPARAIAREKISVWVSVPSVMGLMTRARQATAANLASVRLFAFCGEPLLREHLDALFAARPSAIAYNTYGPTEATVSMTSLPLSADNYHKACGASVALGAPIPNMGLHLVGGPDPDEGEIVITGPQLARGYWRDPEQTERAFRPLDLEGQSTRGYFTGDWARRVEGQLYFQNRLDFQVKVHGYRLELDEVAAAIRALGWPNVCVLVWRGEVTAIVETSNPSEFDPEQFRADLVGRIENHAIPAVARPIASLPRGENDKIDRAAILAWLDGAA